MIMEHTLRFTSVHDCYVETRRKPSSMRGFGCDRAVIVRTAMSAGPNEHDVTRLIAAWRGGDVDAREALVERVYANVRAIAAQSLRQMPGATLSATDLAHEALIRLLGANAEWTDRRHFFHVAAQATRQILVDAARQRLAEKRGGGVERVDFDLAQGVAANDNDSELVRVDDALRDLQHADARRAQMIELVYFGGLSRVEVAQALQVSEGTVDRDLRLARAWLRIALEA
jgi:RNA polymerase sigma factor (TIGR02999 family)